jgi:hypothetical protein
MDSFEPVEMQNSDLEDDDFDVAFVTSNREAFTGFANLGAMRPLPIRELAAPWRPPKASSQQALFDHRMRG